MKDFPDEMFRRYFFSNSSCEYLCFEMVSTNWMNKLKLNQVTSEEKRKRHGIPCKCDNL
jgi:hypothetical protein